MRLVALLPSPGFRSFRERSAATEVGTARLAVEVGMESSVCSSA